MFLITLLILCITLILIGYLFSWVVDKLWYMWLDVCRWNIRRLRKKNIQPIRCGAEPSDGEAIEEPEPQW